MIRAQNSAARVIVVARKRHMSRSLQVEELIVMLREAGGWVDLPRSNRGTRYPALQDDGLVKQSDKHVSRNSEG